MGNAWAKQLSLLSAEEAHVKLQAESSSKQLTASATQIVSSRVFHLTAFANV